MFDFKAYLQTKHLIIDQALAQYLPVEEASPTVLSKAMRYSMFSGGKRFRPVLCLATAQALAGSSEEALLPACALEALHTYSLIHDDLPPLDDDKERRGKPTSHIVFGEANAILAGDGLLTLAFEWIAQSKPKSPYTAGDLCIELAEAGGPNGIVGGQVEDLLAEGQSVNEKQMLAIHTLKTVSLFRATVRIGAMSSGASPEVLEALTKYGNAFGMAYQIVDDMDDYEEEGETSSDVRLKKLTAVAVYGLDGAKKKAHEYINEAITQLESIPLQAEGLEILRAITMSITVS